MKYVDSLDSTFFPFAHSLYLLLCFLSVWGFYIFITRVTPENLMLKSTNVKNVILYAIIIVFPLVAIDSLIFASALFHFMLPKISFNNAN